ncbi:MAG: hypothetical protein EOP93_19140, partial [Lysobacteraceae bacterium]
MRAPACGWPCSATRAPPAATSTWTRCCHGDPSAGGRAVRGPTVRVRGGPGLRAPRAAAGTQADAEFWRGFGDPLLTRLVEQALAANHDLRIALANLDRAEALRGGARLDAWPRITAGANAAGNRASADQLPGAGRDARDSESYDVGAQVSWELDLVGRVRRGIEARRADADAARADLRAMQV